MDYAVISAIAFFIIEDRLLTPHADDHITAKLKQQAINWNPYNVAYGLNVTYPQRFTRYTGNKSISINRNSIFILWFIMARANGGLPRYYE